MLSHAQPFVTQWTVLTRLLCPWNSPGKNTGVGCHGLLQSIFPTQGSNPCLLHLLHWQMSSLPLAWFIYHHLGSSPLADEFFTTSLVHYHHLGSSPLASANSFAQLLFQCFLLIKVSLSHHGPPVLSMSTVYIRGGRNFNISSVIWKGI